jgi:hypothetical protein
MASETRITSAAASPPPALFLAVRVAVCDRVTVERQMSVGEMFIKYSNGVSILSVEC